MRAEFTPEGWARVCGKAPGPCTATSAVLALEPDGEQVTVMLIPDTEPASSGRTVILIGAPPGGGVVRSADLIAEDGTAILRVRMARPVFIEDGGTLLVQVRAG
jgi:hypothetical protein